MIAHPLRAAAAMGCAEVVSRLLAAATTLAAKQALVDAASADGWTPLHVAAAGGHTAVVQTLLAAGASVLPAAPADPTAGRLIVLSGAPPAPLFIAAVTGHLDVVTALLLHTRGARVALARAHAQAALAGAVLAGNALLTIDLLTAHSAHARVTATEGVPPRFRMPPCSWPPSVVMSPPLRPCCMPAHPSTVRWLLMGGRRCMYLPVAVTTQPFAHCLPPGRT